MCPEAQTIQQQREDSLTIACQQAAIDCIGTAMREMEELHCVSPHELPSAGNHSVQSLVTGIKKVSSR